MKFNYFFLFNCRIFKYFWRLYVKKNIYANTYFNLNVNKLLNKNLYTLIWKTYQISEQYIFCLDKLHSDGNSMCNYGGFFFFFFFFFNFTSLLFSITLNDWIFSISKICMISYTCRCNYSAFLWKHVSSSSSKLTL